MFKKSKKSRKVADREGREPPALGHFAFLGAPGTGKTTLARITADILHNLGYLATNRVKETSGLNLTGGFVGQTKEKVNKQLDEAVGGVLFIDEAYELGKGQFGEEAVTALVEAMTSPKYASVVIIFAGYDDQIRSMLDTNPGLKSRLKHLWTLPSWNPEQCLQYVVAKAKDQLFSVDKSAQEVLLKCFKQLIGLPGWANCRDAVTMWEKLQSLRANRVADESRPGKTILLEDAEKAAADLLSARSGRSVQKVDGAALLASLANIDTIRAEIQKISSSRRVAEKERRSLPEIGHFAFLGSPGTGKTTLARAMGAILCELGALPSNHVIETTGLDLTASFIGQTKEKVTKKLEEALGGVLFIDEAYELGKGTYGEEAMTTLVAAMTDPKYATLVIIIAGYDADIRTMLDRNEGLKSRFRHVWNLPDWKPQQCLDLIVSKSANANYILSEATQRTLLKGFSQLSSLRGWANVRDVLSVWDRLQSARDSRVDGQEAPSKELQQSDAEEALKEILLQRRGGASDADQDGFALLDELENVGPIREKINAIVSTRRLAEAEKRTPPALGHFALLGSPGTGKSTLARAMGSILNAAGALPSSHYIQTSGLDLTGQFVGQTKEKVQKKLDEALGGVLFIDEAYELGKGQYGEEAMTTLLAAMTDPKYATMAIIIAGYEADIVAMLERNSGLKSRFQHFWSLPDWTAEQCAAFVANKAKKMAIALDEEAKAPLQEGFAELRRLAGWANCRDVLSVLNRMESVRATRLTDEPKGPRGFTISDTVGAVREMLSARRLQPVPTAPREEPVVRTQTPGPRPNEPKQEQAKPVTPSKTTSAVDHIEQNPQVAELVTEIAEQKVAEAKEVNAEDTDPLPEDAEVPKEWFGMEFSRLLLINAALERQSWFPSIDGLRDGSNAGRRADVINSLMAAGASLEMAEQILLEWQYAYALLEQHRLRAEAEAQAKAAEAKAWADRKPVVQCQVCRRTADYWTPCPVAPKQIGWKVDGKLVPLNISV